MRQFRVLARIFVVLLALYISAFVWCFDVFSSPVRTTKQGWLGPLIRGDMHSQYAGKVYEDQSEDLSYYRAFLPLRKLWLMVQGLS
jgi:hypothetical protein